MNGAKKESPYTVAEANELLQLSLELNNLSGFSFGMALADAVEILEKEKKVIEKIKEPSEAYKAYEKEKTALNEKWAEKDETGKPKMTPERIGDYIRHNYVISDDDKPNWGKEFQKLEKKHAAAIKEEKEKMQNFKDALQEKSTFLPIEIDMKVLKKNEINAGQMRIIRKLFILKGVKKSLK